ncbi:esterase/lipase family protein [Gordonia sp. NPDC003504]
MHEDEPVFHLPPHLVLLGPLARFGPGEDPETVAGRGAPSATSFARLGGWQSMYHARIGPSATTAVAEAAVVRGRPSPPAAREPAPGPHIDVTVGEGQSAIVLIDDGGVLRWITPSHGAAASRTLTFALPAPPPRRARTASADSTIDIGLGSDVLSCSVFRFPLSPAIGGVVTIAESLFTRTRLVHVNSAHDPDWPALATVPPPRGGQPTRILLLVHGIFVTTRFTFRWLTEFDAGTAFLNECISRYHLVLGFDHRTLSVDPKVNAAELLSALKGLGYEDIDLDVIAHSRGSLVTRSLLESVATPADRVRVGKLIMVGGPNAGTPLGNPDWWRLAVDLFTNLVAGHGLVAGRSTATGHPPADGSLDGCRPIAEMIKAVVSAGDSRPAIPGLAAMAPDSPYLAELNSPSASTGAKLFSITTDFEPHQADPPFSGPELALWTALDTLADAAFTSRDVGETNDLAVGVRSMSMVDNTPLPETFHLPPITGINHLRYFTDADVVARLRSWLEPDTR